jgi:hypothetical protein
MLSKSMDFDKALEFAIIASWDDLVKPEESNSIHVEYTNVDGIPVKSLEVWATYRGHGNRVCDYPLVPSSSSQPRKVQFVNSCASHTLAEALNFIMQNQTEFCRPTGRGAYGLVRIGVPNKAERASAAQWWLAMVSEVVRKAPPSYLQPS